MYDEDEDNLGAEYAGHLAPVDQQHVVFEGMLKKKSPKGFVKVWQDRWFKLTADCLYYYKKREANLEQGVVPIHAISTITFDPANLRKQRYRFDLQLHDRFGGRVFSFIAKSEPECVGWVGAIRKVHAEYQDKEGHDLPAGADADPSRVWKGKAKGAKFDLAAGVTPAFASNYGFAGLRPASAGPLPKPTLLEPIDAMCPAFFGDYKMQTSEEMVVPQEYGSAYMLGDGSYDVTHRSYLLHAVPRSSPHFAAMCTALTDLRALARESPLLSRIFHLGETSDTAYALVHPPLRPSVDSIWSWMGEHAHFPTEAVRYVGACVLSLFDALHARGRLLRSLSPETLYFDRDGVVRFHDPCLCLPAASAPVVSVEYTCPEVATGGAAKATTKSDFWRLGVLLYELATGVPPFRQQDPAGGEDDEEILRQIRSFRVAELQFPPGLPAELLDVIVRLMDVNPASRLGDVAAVQRHPFFAPVADWALPALLSHGRPQWITDNIVAALDKAPHTPSNLTFVPEAMAVQRVGISVLNARGLPAELSQRAFCTITIEGEAARTKVSQEMAWDESFLFDMLHGTHAPLSSEIVIEVLSKQLESEGKNPLVGIAAVPLRHLQSLGQTEALLTILNAQGFPVGELRVVMGWCEDFYELDSGVLATLSTPQRSLAETFGKPAVAAPARLWSYIVDPSAIPAAGGDPENAVVVAPLPAPLSAQSPMASQSANGGGLVSSTSSSALGAGWGNTVGRTAPPPPSTSSGSLRPVPPPATPGSSMPAPPPFPGSYSTVRGGAPPHLPSPGSTSGRPSAADANAPLSPLSLSHGSSGTAPPPIPAAAFPGGARPVPPPFATVGANGASMRSPPQFVPPGGRAPAGSFGATAPPASRPSAALPPPPPVDVTSPSSFDAAQPTWSAPEAQSNSALELERAKERQRQLAREEEMARARKQQELAVQQQEASGMDPEDIPGNWRTAFDANLKATYYYNKITRRTTWDPPACIPK